MFTGIVEEKGRVVEVVETASGRRLRVAAKKVVEDADPGASISHNGVCLTVTALEDDGYWVEAVRETLSRSTLGDLAPGDHVNLERPVRIADRLGGHLVQGHVDGVAIVEDVLSEGDSTRMRFRTGAEVVRYVVEKGSVAVDGVSLTVTHADSRGFAVAVIPHTTLVTTLGEKQRGDRVNVEVDVIAKYVEKLMVAERDLPAVPSGWNCSE